MTTAGLTEQAVAPWAAVLDAAERARAARFAFSHSRIAFIAAHALARAALAAAAGAPPAAFGFSAGPHGKPEPTLDGQPAGLAFNISHTDGVVGVAVAAGENLPLGLDLEPIDRRASMEVARRFFSPGEVAWLEGLPASGREKGFVRLWTLKEAFIKATGKGLTQNLSTFWFSVDPPVIGFAPASPERPGDWVFEQRIVHGAFLAALGVRRPGGEPPAIWRELAAAEFDPFMLPPGPGMSDCQPQRPGVKLFGVRNPADIPDNTKHRPHPG